MWQKAPPMQKSENNQKPLWCQQVSKRKPITYNHNDVWCIWHLKRKLHKNSSGDEIANVNFYAVCPEATRNRWNNATVWPQ